MPLVVRGGGGGKNTKDATAVPGDVAKGKIFYNSEGRQIGDGEILLPFKSRTLFFPKGTYQTQDSWTYPSPAYINPMSKYMAIGMQGAIEETPTHNNNWQYLNVPAKDCKIKIKYGSMDYNVLAIDYSTNFYVIGALHSYSDPYYYFAIAFYIENGLLVAIGTHFRNRYYTYDSPEDLTVEVEYRG